MYEGFDTVEIFNDQILIYSEHSSSNQGILLLFKTYNVTCAEDLYINI